MSVGFPLTGIGIHSGYGSVSVSRLSRINDDWIYFRKLTAPTSAVRWNYDVPMAVLARIVRIGNSGGLRISKVLLEEASLTDRVELRAEPGKRTVSAVRSPRSGWTEAAREAHAAGDDRLLDPPSQADFDESDWRW